MWFSARKKSPPVNRREEIFLPGFVPAEGFTTAAHCDTLNAVFHIAQPSPLRAAGEMGCKAPRVGHCEAAVRRISQNTRRLQAFPPEPEAAGLNRMRCSADFAASVRRCRRAEFYCFRRNVHEKTVSVAAAGAGSDHEPHAGGAGCERRRCAAQDDQRHLPAAHGHG